MKIMLVNQGLAIPGQRRIHPRKFLQRRDTGFHDKCQRRESNAPFSCRTFERLPFRFQFGNVGKIVLSDMRQVDPARLQSRA